MQHLLAGGARAPRDELVDRRSTPPRRSTKGRADAAEATTIAKAYVSRAARAVVESALQVFGGIGFTWEHDLHLYLRRVLACEQRFGDAPFHERQLAAAKLTERARGRTRRKPEGATMAWDFSTEPEFDEKLEWMREFVREEIIRSSRSPRRSPTTISSASGESFSRR